MDFILFCVWTICFSPFDNCEYMVWQQDAKEELLKKLIEPTLRKEAVDEKSREIRHISFGQPAVERSALTV